MKIIIKKKTPSINHLYGFKGYHKFLTKEAKELRQYIDEVVKKKVGNLNLDIEDYEDKKLTLLVEIYENWLTKSGDVYKKDISNREKFLVDSIFKSLGLDDKFIWDHTMKKIQSTEEKAVVEIKPFRI